MAGWGTTTVISSGKDVYIHYAAPEFACLDQPIPGTAPATLTVAGDVGELTTGGTVAKSGITVEAFIVGNNTPVDSDVSASGTGAYSVSAP